MIERRRHGVSRIAGLLAHPVSLAAVAVLLVNDHLLKGASPVPGWATGKLSDVAGLFFFPLLLAVPLVAALDWALEEVSPRRCLRWAGLATAAVFALVNTWPAFNRALGVVWGPFTVDPTDLATLPAVWLGVRWGRRQLQHDAGTGVATRVRALAVCLAAFASLATQPAPNRPRAYPFWENVRGDTVSMRTENSVRLVGWVVRSGKEGIGVVVQAANGGHESHTVTLESAKFFRHDPARGGTTAVRAEDPDRRIELPSGEHGALYLPFVFDNEAAWNRGVREGRLEIRLALDGRELSVWDIHLRQVRESPHCTYRHRTLPDRPHHCGLETPDDSRKRIPLPRVEP